MWALVIILLCEAFGGKKEAKWITMPRIGEEERKSGCVVSEYSQERR